MQNEIYNGDIYYKREIPSVLYSLRGYNTNWHFPETVNKVGASSGYTGGVNKCPYDGPFAYKHLGQVAEVKMTAIGDCSAVFEVTGQDQVNGIYVRQGGIFNGDVYYKRESPTVLYALRGYNRNWHFSVELDKNTVRSDNFDHFSLSSSITLVSSYVCRSLL